MKKPRIIYVITSTVLLCALMLNLTGCASKNLMTGIRANAVSGLGDLKEQNAIVTDFAVRLFKASVKNGENTLISPLSVLYALSMTANGAEQKTLEEMQNVLGMTTKELNLYMYTYLSSLEQGKKYKLNLANSIWFNDGSQLKVNKDFLQTNADYYGADVFEASFDKSTLNDINKWVDKKTDGMIPKILDEIRGESVMYLINALAFEAEWDYVYESSDVSGGLFTKEDGTTCNASYMYSLETAYLKDENAKGFIKYYRDNKYAFAALLPDEDITVSEYLESLDGEALYNLLSNPNEKYVKAYLPKFETETDLEMSSVLQNMGIVEAFDCDKADFGKLGTSTTGNIHINSVIHKTSIKVEEKGTKAAAATVSNIVACGGDYIPLAKTVKLDRPFVYMLIDCENNIPFFIGTMMDVEK